MFEYFSQQLNTVCSSKTNILGLSLIFALQQNSLEIYIFAYNTLTIIVYFLHIRDYYIYLSYDHYIYIYIYIPLYISIIYCELNTFNIFDFIPFTFPFSKYMYVFQWISQRWNVNWCTSYVQSIKRGIRKIWFLFVFVVCITRVTYIVFWQPSCVFFDHFILMVYFSDVKNHIM